MSSKGPASETSNSPSHSQSCEPAPQIRESAPLFHLATAIVQKRAIVYVGAGASVPSGGPLWSQLLEWLCEKGAEPVMKGTKSFEYLKKALEQDKRYLEVADLLQEILDNDLPRFLREKFRKVFEPSSIHVNIGRIPFNALITTNYDDLLELAYTNSISGRNRPYVHTWNTPDAILQAIQNNERFILKTHGKVDDGSSLILSSRQYRNLMFANPLYWQILKWLFMTRTWLFVGCSLTDPDLLHLFEEAITQAGENFGPHYALLPKKEAPDIKVQNLLRQLKVKVLILDPEETKVSQKDKKEGRELEIACSRELVNLAGEVARQMVITSPPPLPSSDDYSFFLIEALKKLLQAAVEVTGSFRGDICLLADTIGGRESGDLRYKVAAGPTLPQLDDTQVEKNSICGIAYHESSPQKGVYISDVEASDEEKNRSLQASEIWHWGEINYLAGHTEVKSELALPILADGVRVGVLNLESRLKEAYVEGHIAAAHWFAGKAGRLFVAAQERNRRGRGLKPEIIREIQPQFLEILRRLWAIRNVTATNGRKKYAAQEHIECLVFHADYIDGMLRAKTKIPESDKPEETKKREVEVEFKFDTQPSFAATVFRERSGAYCPDAGRALREGAIAKTYVEELDIAGPLLGFPIYVHGYAAGVVACWHRNGTDGYIDWRDMELFRRAAHLIANASTKDSLLKPVKWHAEPREKQETPEKLPNEDHKLSSEDQKRVNLAREHMSGADQILDWFDPPERPSGGPPVKKDGISDENLYNAWLNPVRQIASLLELLWIRYGKHANNWLVPTRARLWIACQANDGKPQKDGKALQLYGLAAQITFNKEALDRASKEFLQSNNADAGASWARFQQEVAPIVSNLFKNTKKETEPTFLIAGPNPTVSEGLSLQDFMPLNHEKDSNNAGDAEPRKEVVLEPNMAFLLSRWWADGFARLQSLEADENPLADWFEYDGGGQEESSKNKDQAANKKPVIYATPIIRVLNEPHCENKKPVILEKEISRFGRQEVAGILVLDSLGLTDDARKSPTNERHITLQNELLHTVDLFTACLAETREFHAAHPQQESAKQPAPDGSKPPQAKPATASGD